MKYREGLIIGSACEAGELFQALVRAAPEADIARIVNFYDYLEIQPMGNNAFMLRDENSTVKTEEDLQDYEPEDRRRWASSSTSRCVATCDVHFLNPEDEIYRRIIMAGKGFKDCGRSGTAVSCGPRRRCWRSLIIWAAGKGGRGGHHQHQQDRRHV